MIIRLQVVIGLLIMVFMSGCVEAGDIEDQELSRVTATDKETKPIIIVSPTLPIGPITPSDNIIQTKWDLWNSSQTMLRGANIWQALVIEELDDLEFKGDGHVGPPFTQQDFDNLAALGANYVTISGPGLFTETPPFELDLEVQANLDRLLEMIANADMFATISFRTGPGRSEYYLCCSGEAYFEDYFNDTMWEDQIAQDAWVDMWEYTADRYRDNPIVVGYKLMVEPNSNDMYFDIWEPEEFYPSYKNTTFDWNQLYPGIVEAIREVDQDTPILINAMSYSAIDWLPFMKVLDAEKIVYIVHQYSPHQYTHQELPTNSYPGEFDTDWDGEDDRFDKEWLEELLATIDDFKDENAVPVGVDEFGIVRWVPNASEYMFDLIDLFEQRGLNYSLWEWSTSWRPFEEEVNAFNFRFGPDMENTHYINNEMLEAIQYYWKFNSIVPSNVPWINLDD